MSFPPQLKPEYDFPGLWCCLVSHKEIGVYSSADAVPGEIGSESRHKFQFASKQGLEVKARLQAKPGVTVITVVVPSWTAGPHLAGEELFLNGSDLAAVNSLQTKSGWEHPSLLSSVFHCLVRISQQSALWSQRGWQVTALPGVMSLHSTGGPGGGGTCVWYQGWPLIESCRSIPGV